MNKVMKGLAIAVLLITVIGAGVVLYGLYTYVPQVEQVAVMAIPAEQAQEAFDGLMAQIDQLTFTGYQFSAADDLSAADCTFLTYAVRLKNRGFFPAEWISLKVEPQQSADGASRDVLQLADAGAHVLPAGSEGDLTATILRTGDASEVQRKLSIVCYVFGQKVEFAVDQEPVLAVQ